MILVDAGPLIALIDKGQGNTHIRCVQTYQMLTGNLYRAYLVSFGRILTASEL